MASRESGASCVVLHELEAHRSCSSVLSVPSAGLIPTSRQGDRDVTGASRGPCGLVVRIVTVRRGMVVWTQVCGQWVQGCVDELCRSMGVGSASERYPDQSDDYRQSCEPDNELDRRVRLFLFDIETVLDQAHVQTTEFVAKPVEESVGPVLPATCGSGASDTPTCLLRTVGVHAPAHCRDILGCFAEVSRRQPRGLRPRRITVRRGNTESRQKTSETFCSSLLVCQCSWRSCGVSAV